MRIGAFAIVVPSYDAGIAFYVGKLGFDLLEDTDMGDGKRWVVVRPPGGGSAVVLAKAVNGEQEAAIGKQTGGRVSFFLESRDFDEDHADFVAAGVLFEETPRREPYGMVAVFRDPFGNRWDLLGRS